MTISRENLGLILGLIGMLLFAGTLPASRIAVASLDPAFLTAGRAAIAGVLGAAILLATRRRLPCPRDLRDIAVAAACLVLGFPLLSALAMMTVPAAHGGVVLGILPLATAAAMLAHERPSPAFWLSGLAGTVLVVAFAVRGGGGGIAAGDLFLLGSIVTAAVGYTLAGKLSLTMPGWEVISWCVALSLPLSIPATLFFWPADLGAVTGPAWGALAYVALISQLGGFFLWNAGLALGGIARVGQLQLLQPFVIVAMAAVVNGESLETTTLVFAIAVVATVLVGQRTRVRR